MPPTATPTIEINVAVGIVTALGGGTITVKGVVYRLETAPDAGVQVGRTVRVYYRRQPDGVLVAYRVELLFPVDPTSTPGPSARHRQGGHRISRWPHQGGRHGFVITGSTQIVGERLAVGQDVAVDGHVGDDNVTNYADHIEVQSLPSVPIDGVLLAIEGSLWNVGGRTVDVGHASISGTPVVGAFVTGSGHLRGDGVILADAITNQAPTATPSPTSEATATSVPPTARRRQAHCRR